MAVLYACCRGPSKLDVQAPLEAADSLAGFPALVFPATDHETKDGGRDHGTEGEYDDDPRVGHGVKTALNVKLTVAPAPELAWQITP